MEQRTRVFLAGLIALAGAVGFLGLTVYPFEYGPAESALLVGLFVGAGLFETVLRDATF